MSAVTVAPGAARGWPPPGAAGGRVFGVGERVRYHSRSSGQWLDAVVLGYNEAATWWSYRLDVHPQAAPSQVAAAGGAPPAALSPTAAGPPGSANAAWRPAAGAQPVRGAFAAGAPPTAGGEAVVAWPAARAAAASPPPQPQQAYRCCYSGALQRGCGPELWGISLEQLRSLVRHPRHAAGMTTRDVVEAIIKPDTAGAMAGLALLKNLDRPLRARVMVCHAWDSPYSELVAALERSGEQGPFWLCATALYQREDVPALTIDRQLGLEAGGPITAVLSQAEALLCVLSEEPFDIYARLWCLFEIHAAVQLGVEVRVTKRSRGFSWGVIDELLISLCEKPVNSRLARCGPMGCPVNADEQAIRGAIEATPGGHAAFDAAVEGSRRDALAQGRDLLLGRGWGQTEFGRRYAEALQAVEKRLDGAQRRLGPPALHAPRPCAAAPHGPLGPPGGGPAAGAQRPRGASPSGERAAAAPEGRRHWAPVTRL